MSTAATPTLATPVDPAEFKRVVGHFASGVTVVSCCDNGDLKGTTASAFCSVSAEPPMIALCMNTASQTGAALERVGTFVVNILGSQHRDLAVRFAVGGGDFEGVDVVHGSGGHPLLRDAHAALECEVVSITPAGTHHVVVAHVTATHSAPGRPLAYYRGAFGDIA